MIRPLVLLASIPLLATAVEPVLQPLLAVPDKVVMQDDFSTTGPFNKQHWGARQGTQWKVENGVLLGRPSTPEFQAKKKDHFGYEPRISAPVTPAQFVAQMSVRFVDGSPTAITPFIEFGHHVCRLLLKEDGAELLADGESVKLAMSKELRFQPGKWYHLLAEMKGEEFVIQFQDGPVIYARHASFAKEPASGGNGVGLAGTKGGTVEIDNVTLWSIKPEEQPGWHDKRSTFPAFTPVPVEKKKGKGKSK